MYALIPLYVPDLAIRRFLCSAPVSSTGCCRVSLLLTHVVHQSVSHTKTFPLHNGSHSTTTYRASTEPLYTGYNGPIRLHWVLRLSMNTKNKTYVKWRTWSPNVSAIYDQQVALTCRRRRVLRRALFRRVGESCWNYAKWIKMRIIKNN